MNVGKVPFSALEQLVFRHIQNKRREVLMGAGIGEDCAAIQFGSEELCVVSTDPITGATKDIGHLAVHITCNDLASSGAEPIGILVTILLPPEAKETELSRIMEEIETTAKTVNVQIIGGHTEVTDAVVKPVISVTGIGKTKLNKLISSSCAKPGQDIVMTKWAGLEGTAILAADYEEELTKVFDEELVKNAKEFTNYLSVLTEGQLAVTHGATAMHDVTEGGILGAVWEMAHCSKVGVKLYINQIPVREETKKICEFFQIDPLKLISSGTMLISTERGKELADLLKNLGIPAAVIGETTDNQELTCITGHTAYILEQPKEDELYKVNKTNF